MTTAQWLEKCLADAPPLTQAQVAVLRPVFAHVTPHMKTATAETVAESSHPQGTASNNERSCNGQR